MDLARDIIQLPKRAQRGRDTAGGIEIQPECFGELQNRDPIIIPGRDQLWNLVIQLHLSLEDVETRYRAGLKTILLIFELTFEQADRFLLHNDQLAVQDDLVKLRFHRRDRLIDGVAKREVSRVALEERPAKRAERAVIKNQLFAGDLNIVIQIVREVLGSAMAAAAATTTAE